MAMKLGIKPGEVVLDVGCGVGGPAREIATFTDANVFGLNNNDYQYTSRQMAHRTDE
jgi:sterol 24-C-methyltransferase